MSEVTSKQIAEMVEMRKAGKSFGEISKHYGWKYPAQSRHYILKVAAKEVETISARKLRTTPKPVALHEQMYDMSIEVMHGNGTDYGCGKPVGEIKLLDPQASAKTHEMLRLHKLHCNRLTDDRPGTPIKGRDDDAVRPVKTGKLSGAHRMRKV